MNAHSLKSRQLLAALRTLPECRPHNVNGVSAYVEAADKVEELERALGVLRQNMDAAVGTMTTTTADRITSAIGLLARVRDLTRPARDDSPRSPVHELTRDALGMLAQVNQIQTREGTAARLGNDPIVSLERYDCRHDREAWSWRAVLAVHGPIPAGWDETDRDETILRACEDSFGIRVQQETEGGPGGAFAEFPVVEYWPSVRDCRTIYVSQRGGLDV